jgi:8-oxo-dGTP diphosphatase
MACTYEYPRPAVTVDCLISRRQKNGAMEILLVKRRYEPFSNSWALPGGFIHMDETLHDAAVRELKEETGLSMPHLEQFHTFDEVDRDPRHRTISTVFTARADPSGTDIRAASDAREVRWFPLTALPPLAFDHEKIIRLALERDAL